MSTQWSSPYLSQTLNWEGSFLSETATSFGFLISLFPDFSLPLVGGHKSIVNLVKLELDKQIWSFSSILNGVTTHQIVNIRNFKIWRLKKIHLCLAHQAVYLGVSFTCHEEGTQFSSYKDKFAHQICVLLEQTKGSICPVHISLLQPIVKCYSMQ